MEGGGEEQPPPLEEAELSEPEPEVLSLSISLLPPLSLLSHKRTHCDGACHPRQQLPEAATPPRVPRGSYTKVSLSLALSLSP